VNPGDGSTTGKGDIYGIFRSQTIRFVDKGSKFKNGDAYLIHGSFPISKINSSIGAFFSEQKHGLEVVQNAELNLSHGFKVGEGILGVGFNAGMEMLNYSGGLVLKDDTDPFKQIIKNNNTGKPHNLFNVDGGILYRTNRLYYGLSVLNAYSQKIKDDYKEYKENTQSIYIIGGYNYQTSNPSINLKPSFSVLKVVNSLSRINLCVIGEYNKFLAAGVSYTTGNNVALIVGGNFPETSEFNGLRFYASYDMWANKLWYYNFGSFEFTVGYAFNANVYKLKKTYKSVRFL